MLGRPREATVALGLDDVAVGTWTASTGGSGCTVVLPPPETVGAIAVRGQAPGTREAAALAPGATVQHVDAIVLSGGSAYGLATADGVMAALEERGRGHPVPGGIVPIVAAAIILDGGATDPTCRPDAASGRAAVDAASTQDPVEGRVGAGAGATVAKVGGFGHRRPGGQGVAVRRHPVPDGELVVAALVVNNAVGDVVDDDGTVLVGTGAPGDAPRWPQDPDALWRGLEPNPPTAPADARQDTPADARQNTVVGCIVTNAVLSKLAAHRVADLGHDGLVRAVRPAHTSLDGDALFALATGRVAAGLDLVTTLAVEAVAEAARRGPMAAVAT